MTRVAELFRNKEDAGFSFDGEEDHEAFYEGAAFTETEAEEWAEWIDWELVEAQTAGAGSSSA